MANFLDRSKRMPARQELLGLFIYHPVTGIFINRVTRSPTAVAGSVAGNIGNLGYVLIRINKEKFLAHRLAWVWMSGEDPIGYVIDHADNNHGNNAWDNLRRSTLAQNNQNQRIRSANSSGVKGVSWNGYKNLWAASVISQKHGRICRNFKTIAEAEDFVMEQRSLMHGEFANHGEKNNVND